MKIKDWTRSRLAKVGLATGLGLAALGGVAVVAPSAGASVGQAVAIPAYGGTTNVRASLTYWNDPYCCKSTAAGQAAWTEPATGSFYLQVKMVAIGAADGSWQTVGSTWKGSGSVSESWRDDFHLNYSGVKFRICKSGVGCGTASATIYA